MMPSFRFNTGGPIPDFHTHMDLMSHLGTHCECPYHHDDNWPSAADLPLTTFLGRAVYVDFKDTVAKRGHITAADLDREAGKVKEGDIVIIDSSYKLAPFTPDTNTDKDERLLVGAESAQWFKDHKVKAVASVTAFLLKTVTRTLSRSTISLWLRISYFWKY